MKIELRAKLQEKFEKVPALMNLYDSHNPTFVIAVKCWFQEVENVLQENRMPQVGELAGLRGAITAAENGVRDTSYVVDAAVRPSKAAVAVAAINLKRAQDTLHMALEPINRKLEEAGNMIRRILAVAAQFGIISMYSEPGGGLAISVKEFWEVLAAKDNLSEGLMSVLAIVSHQDAVCLMKEYLDDWPQHLFQKQLSARQDTKAAGTGSDNTKKPHPEIAQ